jgi:hypothetical protein
VNCECTFANDNYNDLDTSAEGRNYLLVLVAVVLSSAMNTLDTSHAPFLPCGCPCKEGRHIISFDFSYVLPPSEQLSSKLDLIRLLPG